MARGVCCSSGGHFLLCTIYIRTPPLLVEQCGPHFSPGHNCGPGGLLVKAATDSIVQFCVTAAICSGLECL